MSEKIDPVAHLASYSTADLFKWWFDDKRFVCPLCYASMDEVIVACHTCVARELARRAGLAPPHPPTLAKDDVCPSCGTDSHCECR